MYLTIFTKAKEIKPDFNWILDNPFATIPKPAAKKITLEITEDYGKELYEKHLKQTLESYKPLYDIPYTEINNSYRTCRIPKKSNPEKTRRLDIPNEILKATQTYYKTLIEDVMHVQSHDAAYAYIKNRDIVKANEKHQKNESKWFLQIDLKDFFPSINETFLRNMLLQVYPFKFIPEKQFEDIIHYALYNNAIPQGSPLSPTLTNILMVPIDHAIREKLHNYKKKHYVYTRYADDIKISCKYNFNSNEIVHVILDIFKSFNAPLKINYAKVRYGSIAGKNYYLGIILNKNNQLSPGWKKNKEFRAMLYTFIHNHEDWTIHDVQKMLGIISYYNNIEPEFIKTTINKYNTKYNIDIIAKAKEIIRGA